MSRTQCYEWFKRFEKGRMSVGEDPRPGRPSTSTDDDHVERVRAVSSMKKSTDESVKDQGNVGYVF